MIKRSPSLRRRLGGRIAKISGDRFENSLVTHCAMDKITLIRIPDGCKQIRSGRSLRIIRVKSPFDFLAALNTQTLCFDAKSTIGSTFPFSAINQSQLSHLLDLYNQGIRAGYVINFSRLNKVCFVSAAYLSQIRGRESIKPEDCVQLGDCFSFSLRSIF